MTDFSGLPDQDSPFRSTLRQLGEALLDLIFPPRCVGCNRPGSLLCETCQAKLHVPAPMVNPRGALSERRATADFEGAIQQAIHRLKYENQPRLAVPLAARLADEYQRSGWKATLITAAPMHEARLKQRGYNQAAILASHLARRIAIPFHPEAISRTRDTRAQVGLNYKDRQNNVADAFTADSAVCAEQYIVIVDDVYTTGATLDACAAALRAAGAADVRALTVAAARDRALA
jgi:ComF family protein